MTNKDLLNYLISVQMKLLLVDKQLENVHEEKIQNNVFEVITKIQLLISKIAEDI